MDVRICEWVTVGGKGGTHACSDEGCCTRNGGVAAPAGRVGHWPGRSGEGGSSEICGSDGDGGEPGWDLCYLGHFPRPPGAGEVLGAPAAEGLRHVVGSGVYGLFAYALSRRGARALLKWRHRGRSSTSILPLSAQIDCALAGRTATATLVAAAPPLAFCGLEQCVADSDVQLCT